MEQFTRKKRLRVLSIKTCSISTTLILIGFSDLYYTGHFVDSIQAIYNSYEKEYTEWLEKNRALIAQDLLDERFYCYEVKCPLEDIQQIKNYC